MPHERIYSCSMRMKGKEELPGEFFFFLSLEILLDENI